MVVEQRQLFDQLSAALPDPGSFAIALVPYLRRLVDVPQLKGVLDSVVIESVTEHVRELEFGNRPSRLDCVFGTPTHEQAEAFARKYRPGVPHIIYEVDAAGPEWFADIDAINVGFEYFAMPFRDSLSRQIDLARTYLQPMTEDRNQMNTMKMPEVLAPGGAVVRSVTGVVT